MIETLPMPMSVSAIAAGQNDRDQLHPQRGPAEHQREPPRTTA